MFFTAVATVILFYTLFFWSANKLNNTVGKKGEREIDWASYTPKGKAR
jgi:hypothetical protein